LVYIVESSARLQAALLTFILYNLQTAVVTKAQNATSGAVGLENEKIKIEGPCRQEANKSPTRHVISPPPLLPFSCVFLSYT
jgi:hypothetical protein